MDYTPNFHLPQWEQNDRILMDDFNQFAANLEDALSQNQAAVEAVQETADQVKDRLIPVYTSCFYTGTGGTKKITSSFVPNFLVIIGQPSNNTPAPSLAKYSAVFVRGAKTVCGSITEDGFEVIEVEQEGCPNLNKKGWEYHAYGIELRFS